MDVLFHFTAGAKKAGPKRKKAISKTQTTQVPNTADETVAETAADVTIQPTARMLSTKRSNDWIVNLNEFLRCMDPDILNLFDEELVLKYPLPNELIGTRLGLLEFKYVCNLFLLSSNEINIFSLIALPNP